MIKGEPDLRGEPRRIKAEKTYHSQNPKAVGSEATKLDIFFHVIHYGVQIIFFKKDIRQPYTVFFVKALGGGFGCRHINAHFLMQEWN
jgi:hypothetical protein